MRFPNLVGNHNPEARPTEEGPNSKQEHTRPDAEDSKLTHTDPEEAPLVVEALLGTLSLGAVLTIAELASTVRTLLVRFLEEGPVVAPSPAGVAVEATSAVGQTVNALSVFLVLEFAATWEVVFITVHAIRISLIT